jgi:hypothetical protein
MSASAVERHRRGGVQPWELGCRPQAHDDADDAELAQVTRDEEIKRMLRFWR